MFACLTACVTNVRLIAYLCFQVVEVEEEVALTDMKIKDHLKLLWVSHLSYL